MLFYLRWRARKYQFPVIKTLDLGIIVTIFGFIGARLFHVFYEYPSYYQKNPLAIFKIWEGGYVFLGGLIAGILSGLILIQWRKEKPLRYLDLFAPVIALGYSIGRLACFFQGCCYGKPTTSIFGLHFINLIHTGESFARFPTQLFASIGEFIVYLILISLEKKESIRKIKGQIFFYWMIGHGINRMFMEIYRDDPRGPLWLGMGISFWIAFAVLLSGGAGLKLLRRPLYL